MGFAPILRAINSGEGVLGRFLSPDESWMWRIRRFGEPRDPVAWYLLCDGHRHGWAYFVAYDMHEYRRVVLSWFFQLPAKSGAGSFTFTSPAAEPASAKTASVAPMSVLV